MQKASIKWAALFLFMCSVCAASSYTIKEVFKVGPGKAAIASTLKWSPDGSQLAYFSERALYVSDTLGNGRFVAALDWPAVSYEWVTANEVLVLERIYEGHDRKSKLVLVNIASGNVHTLEENARKPQLQYEGTPFYGPFKTVEGNVLYGIKNAGEHLNKTTAQPVYPTVARDGITKAQSYQDNTIARWGDDGLYFIQGSFRDSIKVAPKPDNYVPLPVVISPDKTRYIYRSLIYNFQEASYIDISSYIDEYPPGTGACGFLDYDFNPRSPEVIVNLIFGGNDDLEIFRMATFDYSTYELTIIDDLIGIYGCESPAYAPDGKKIAFCADGNIHILYREGD